VFPLAGRRSPVAGRPRRRAAGDADDHLQEATLVASAGDESSGEVVVNVVGVFHGGQNLEAPLSADEDTEGD